MRWLIGLIVILICLVIGVGSVLLKDYPYKLYSQWVRGSGYNNYYRLSQYRSDFLSPTAIEDISPYQEDYVQLWKEFPIRNCLIPLPTRHPLFQTIPIVELQTHQKVPQLGMIILSSNLREISRIFTLPTSLYEDHSQGQDLFKLPMFKTEILQHSSEKVWKDMFSYKIDVRPKELNEMVYDLYILHLRSKVFSKNMVRYGLIKNGKAIMELESQDKDYRVEYVLTFNKGNIYSYILKTEIQNTESTKLRSKFLESISFNPVDSSMGKILYTEFKQLNFARQVDQEGMLYLFAAWSQDIENQDLFKDMIYFLERGNNHWPQLEALYKYSFNRYGKTFTTRKDFNEKGDQNIVLQKKIEIENIEKRREIELQSKRPAPLPDMSPEEKMNMYLKKAKEEIPNPKNNKEMIVH